MATKKPGKQVHQIRWLKVADLRLDHQNPRITVPKKAAELDVLRIMYNREALDELAMSFAQHGYFSEEPLVVVPLPKSKGKFTVVEGNRRLATLKILANPKFRDELGADDFPELNDEQQAKLAEVPTVEYANRDQVVPYLGFRHISGIKTWGPFEQARYVALLLSQGASHEEVETAIGDTSRRVRRLHQSYVIYRQMQRVTNSKCESVRSRFSLLEVMLTKRPLREFIGLPRGYATDPDPIPEEKADALIELSSWIFGDLDSGTGALIQDSRLIGSRLAHVVSSEEALEHLRTTRDLEASYELSEGERSYLLKQLAGAERSMSRALSILPHHRSDGDVETHLERLGQVLESMWKVWK